MFDEHIQGKFLCRLARFSCSVVRVPVDLRSKGKMKGD